MDSRTSLLVLSVKGETADRTARPKWSRGVRLVPAQDNFTLLAQLDRLWSAMRREFGAAHYRQVAVVLTELSPAAETQLALFDREGNIGAALENRRLSLSRAMDRVNHRWGRDAVTIGHDARGAARGSGPKIAFTRIPELAEFWE